MREIKFRAWDEFPKYEVGTDGSVWSLNYNHSGERKELKQMLDKDGYNYVFLVIDGKRYKRSVHRMIAIAFIENTLNKPQVNHKDGIRNNNVIDNLEWVTSRENTIHGFKSNGRKPTDKQRQHGRKLFSGTNNPKAKVNEGIARQIRELKNSGAYLKDIAYKFNISTAQVSAIARNKFWIDPELLTNKP